MLKICQKVLVWLVCIWPYMHTNDHACPCDYSCKDFKTFMIKLKVIDSQVDCLKTLSFFLYFPRPKPQPHSQLCSRTPSVDQPSLSSAPISCGCHRWLSNLPGTTHFSTSSWNPNEHLLLIQGLLQSGQQIGWKQIHTSPFPLQNPIPKSHPYRQQKFYCGLPLLSDPMPHGSQISFPPTFFHPIHSSFPASNTRRQLFGTHQLSGTKQVSWLPPSWFPNLVPQSHPQVCSRVHAAGSSGSLFLSLVDPTDPSLLTSPTLVIVSQLRTPSGISFCSTGHTCQKTR